MTKLLEIESHFLRQSNSYPYRVTLNAAGSHEGTGLSSWRPMINV